MVTHFRNDQPAYDAWRQAHANSGYVISWDDREGDESGTRLHRASCGHLNRSVTDDPFPKSCSTSREELLGFWAEKHGGTRKGTECGSCGGHH